MAALLGVRVHLGTVDVLWRNDRLAVRLVDPASLFVGRHLGNVLLGSLTALSTIRGRGAPKHHFRVLCVSFDVGHVRPSARLIEAVDAFLEVGGVISVAITRGRLVLPEHAGFLGAVSVVLK